MSDETPRPLVPAKVVVGGMAILAVGAGLFLVRFLDRSTTHLPPTAPAAHGTSRPTDTSLANLGETLRKEPGLAACRNAVARLNSSLSHDPVLTDAERASLQKVFHLDDGELVEVSSNVFTPLDAYYLDQCFLFHDAARSLGVDDLPARDRALAGFAWVVRQVRLKDGKGPASPPAFVLRRGWGTARDREMVFLALLDQLGIPSCVIVLPDRNRSWICGALADGQIYLFDCRLGLPVPGPSGKDVATLAQVVTQPDLLKPLADLPYDVDFSQAQKAEPRLYCPLTALAPRMRRLEARLSASSRPRLGVEPGSLVKAYRDALGKTGLTCPVRITPPNPAHDDALRVLRSFLVPEEGGSDRPIEGQPWAPRRQRFDESLTPWQLLPLAVRRLPEGSDLGPRLRQGFAKPFLDMAYDPHKPRELLLRGRLDEAVTGLVEIRGTIERLQESLQAEGETGQALENWVEEARRAYVEFLRAQRDAANGKSTEGVKLAQDRMAQVWDPKRAAKPIAVLQAAAGEPRLAEATYYLALAKHELAARAQANLNRQGKATARIADVKAGWQTAADWWRKYLEDYPTSSGAAAAHLNLAEALNAQGEHEAAIQVLRAIPSNLGAWHQRACRLRADQLQKR